MVSLKVQRLAGHGMSAQPVTFAAVSGDPAADPGNIIEIELTEGRLDVQASDDD